MIGYSTPLGQITIHNEYFTTLIGNAVSSCYGVSGMVPKGTPQRLKRLLSGKDAPNTGIVVTGNIDKINVAVHIAVMFGVNINAISQSIMHKVKYTVEDATGTLVNKVTVHIDALKNNG